MSDSAPTIAAAGKSLRESERKHPTKRRDGVLKDGTPSHAASGDMLSAATSDTLQSLQSKIDDLPTYTKMILTTLDVVQGIHPFIVPVVVALRIAVKFETTRRQNDRRVLAVRVSINDLFSVLLRLQHVARGARDNDGRPIDDVLGGLIDRIAIDIKRCTESCDTFQERHVVVRFFKAGDWETELKNFISIFEEHKRNLARTLQLHSYIGIEEANEKLDKIGDDVVSLAESIGAVQQTLSEVFLYLRSSEERELERYVSRLNYDQKTFREDDRLMKQLIEWSVGFGADGNEKAYLKDTQVDLFQSIKQELGKSVLELTEENNQQFMRKFSAQQKLFNEAMKATVEKDNDRLLKLLQKGPHERIMNKDLSLVWQEMRWTTFTKARNLVMAIREYYLDRRRIIDFQTYATKRRALGCCDPEGGALSEVGERKSESTVDQGDTAEKTIEDEWAIAYITISRVQPLLEAFDDDASGLVSVEEVNAFTEARPNGWSLLKWMAYWATGFPLTLEYYYTRVQILLSRIHCLVEGVHPTNRSLADTLVRDWSITTQLDTFLAGVYNVITAADISSDDDSELFGRFKEYIDAEETRIEDILRSMDFCIDAKNALEVVTGPGRLEKYLMPLIYLLLRHAYHALYHAREKRLDAREISNITESFDTLYEAMTSRCECLKELCKFQNHSIKEHLRKTAYGVYYYIDSECRKELSENRYWSTMYFGPSGARLKTEWWGIEYFLPHWRVIGRYPYQVADEIEELHLEDLVYDPEDSEEMDSLSQTQPEPVVHWGISCDSSSCSRYSHLRGVRYICLDCLDFDERPKELTNTIDLCSVCRDNEADRSEDGMHHLDSHDLLELNYCIARRASHAVLMEAVEKVKSLRNGDRDGRASHFCTRCSNLKKARVELERPYWYCMDCTDETLFCLECKDEVDRSRSTLANLGVITTDPQSNSDPEREIPSPGPKDEEDNSVVSRGEDTAAAAETEQPTEDEAEGAAEVVNEGEITAAGEEMDDEDAHSESEDPHSSEADNHARTHRLILCRKLVAGSLRSPPTVSLSSDDQLISMRETLLSFQSKVEQMEKTMSQVMDALILLSPKEISV